MVFISSAGGEDYSIVADVVECDNDTDRLCLRFNITNDSLYEIDEDFFIILDSDDRAVIIGLGDTTVNILDEDSGKLT